MCGKIRDQIDVILATSIMACATRFTAQTTTHMSTSSFVSTRRIWGWQTWWFNSFGNCVKLCFLCMFAASESLSTAYILPFVLLIIRLTECLWKTCKEKCFQVVFWGSLYVISKHIAFWLTLENSEVDLWFIWIPFNVDTHTSHTRTIFWQIIRNCCCCVCCVWAWKHWEFCWQFVNV